MSELIQMDCPDVLSQNQIQPYPTDWNTCLPAPARRQLFCGICETSGRAPSETLSEPAEESAAPPPSNNIPPPVIDLEPDNISLTGSPFSITFDIDSAGGFATSLAVAQQGLLWMATRPPVTNLTSSLHLAPIPVQFYNSESEQWQSKKVPVHHIPHLPFGRLGGLEAIEIYLIFPRLFHPSLKHWVITQEQWTLWTDHILTPAIYDTFPPELIQHLTAGAQHAQTRATAASTEQTTQGKEQPRVQLLHYYIQAQYMAPLWDRIQFHIELKNYTEFQNLHILITAKNLKTQFQNANWVGMWDSFFTTWDHAVNRAYLKEDFYDLAKEVITPDRSFPFHQEPDMDQQPLTLTWRRCCLRSFSHWLHSCDQELNQADPPPTRPGVANSRDSAPFPSRRLRRRQHSAPAMSAENQEPTLPEETPPHGEDLGSDLDIDRSEITYSPTSPHSSSSDSIMSEPPSSTPIQKPCWTETYYPLSLTQDLGSLTIEPHSKLNSALRRNGLLYIQLYNTSKEIFAAGKTYPFANPALDTLALDAGLVKSWQHLGRAISHSPASILRAYIHTKVRCHAALYSCRNNSYGTREEYRVQGTLLQAVHREMTTRLCQHDYPRLGHPQIQSNTPYPFFIHATAQLLDWIRWNINRLCIGFEMVYTLQPHTVVHWEHTRVMMMFLRCLTSTYGGGGHHLRRSHGLWLDRRVLPPADGGDVERIQEGMGIGKALDQYGYGWFLDKLDFHTMIFQAAHRPYMVFNTPTLLSQYHARYRSLITVQRDYIFIHDIFTHLAQSRESPVRAASLLDLLVDVCLRAFRQEVFRTLEQARLKQPLSHRGSREALQGLVPLSAAGFRRVLRQAPLHTEFQYVTSQKTQVNHIAVLFSWLWGWAGDGNNGDWVRKGWEHKTYRLVFRQCFEVITQIFGLQQAREWRATLQYRFIRTNWIIPYPSKSAFWSRTTGVRGQVGQIQNKLQTWASEHPWVSQYYRDHPPVGHNIPVEDFNQLPISGWQRARVPMELSLTLPVIPHDPSVSFTTVSTAAANGPTPTVHLPLPVIKVIPGPTTEGILAYDLYNRFFTRHLRSQPYEDHINQDWLLEHLPRISKQMSCQYQANTRSLRLQDSASSVIDTESVSLTLIPSIVPLHLEEDSDTENLRARRRKAQQRHQTLFDYDKWIRRHQEKFKRYQKLFNEATGKVYDPNDTMSHAEFHAQKQLDLQKCQSRQQSILAAMSSVSHSMADIHRKSFV